MSHRLLYGLLVTTLWIASAQAQPESRPQDRPAYTSTEDLNDVRPFQSWVQDAAITEGIDLEPVVEFSNLDQNNSLFAGVRGAYWVMERLEVGGRYGVVNNRPEGIDSTSGSSDLFLHGRYLLNRQEGWPDIAVGAGIDLPIGAEDVGESSFDFLGFVAMRQEVTNGVTLLANAGFESLELGPNRENGLLLGGGAIFPITDDLAAISEFNIGTAGEFAAVTGGVDLELPPGGHLRAGLALGLDNGAPDYRILFGLAVPVY